MDFTPDTTLRKPENLEAASSEATLEAPGTASAPNPQRRQPDVQPERPVPDVDLKTAPGSNPVRPFHHRLNRFLWS